MNNPLYAIVWYTGDGCSWSAEYTLGIFDDYELACTELEKYVQARARNFFNIDIGEWGLDGDDTIKVEEMQLNKIYECDL